MRCSQVIRSALFVLVGVASMATTAQAGLSYFTLEPCRIIDTRWSGAGGPLFGGIDQVVRSFQVRNVCGVPWTAKAVALNVTVVDPSDPGYAAVFSAGAPSPSTVPSTLNFEAGTNTANGAIVKLDSTYVQVWAGFGSGKYFDLILDVTGYFE